MYEELKKKRFELGKSIDEISAQTRIKKSYLQAIEEGRFDDLPLEVYTRSYIKIYAETLGIDPGIVLKDYEEYLRAKKQTPQRIEPVKVEQTSERKRWSLLAGIIFVVTIIIIFLFWIEKDEKIPPPPTQPAVSETAPIEEKTEQKPENPLQEQKLQIEATDKVWMRVTIDDKEKREFLLDPGQKIELRANKSFKLHIGNAGGVKISFNGEELGKLGETGQVVYLDLPQDKN
uniref:Helix-turn-helix domain-containing protein n=1 Tax=Thermodesulfovibrio aggregans TaxID=86166 RepID=A0A7C4AJQ4_9BACT